MRQLRVLNPALRICAFENSNHLAGLYHIDSAGEYQDICGVDKDYVPEYTEWDAKGHIVKSGWRRVFIALLDFRLTTPQKVSKVCPGFFLHRTQAYVDADRRRVLLGDEIQAKIQKYSENAPIRSWRDPDTGKVETGTVLTDEQNLEVAADIRARDDQYTKEQAEKERWFLQTWQKRGGDIADKPTI